MGFPIETVEGWLQHISHPFEIASAYYTELDERGIPYTQRPRWYMLPTSHPDMRMYSGQRLSYLSDYWQGMCRDAGVDVDGLIAYYRESLNGDPLE